MKTSSVMETSPSTLVQEDFDLRRYTEVLWRRRWEVLAVALLVVIAAVAYTMSQTTRYRASAEVLLRPSTTEQILGGGDQSASNQNLLPVNVQTEIEYMRSRLVHDAVRKELGFEPAISISTVGGADGETEVVSLRAANVDAQRAAQAANVYARTYADMRREQLAVDYRAAADQVRKQVDELTQKINAVEAPLDALDAQIAAAVSLDQLGVLLSRRSALESSVDSQRVPLVNRLDRAEDRVANLELAVSSVEKGGAQIISNAETPGTPFTPQPVRNLAIAVILGLLLGGAVAFVREALDEHVRSVSAFERLTGWSVIGVLPKRRRKNARNSRSITVGVPGSPTSDAYRMLRTALQFEGLNRPLRVIMVTSAQHGEGKSTTVANLAVSLALDGNRVLVLDCDLRHHRLHEFFDVPNDPGLSSILTGQATIEGSVTAMGPQRLSSVLPMRAAITDSTIGIDTQEMLSVLPAGPTPLSPTDILASGRAARVFHELREKYDYVLVDAPPILPVSDVAVLTKHVDGVVFLANDVVSRRGAIRRAVRLLTQVDAPVIGMVVNATPVHQLDGYGDYGSFYHRLGYGPDEGSDRENVSKRSATRHEKRRSHAAARSADRGDR